MIVYDGFCILNLFYWVFCVFQQNTTIKKNTKASSTIVAENKSPPQGPDGPSSCPGLREGNMRTPPVPPPWGEGVMVL